jgi:transcription antitermination factor NusG
MRKEFESYLPLVEEVRRWSDRKKKVLEPLFRGYLFVKLDLKKKLDVIQTDGVVRLVGTANRASSIPEEQIEWIKTILGHPSAAKDVRKENFPAVGKKVEIVAGPLRGIRGVVSRSRGNTRLVIQVETIARAFSVEVPPESLVEAG